jgi:hypothetical protein
VGDWVVLVTGSRSFPARCRPSLRAVLDSILEDHPALTVRHGACRTGPDNWAQSWALSRRYTGSFVTPDPHPAEWAPGGVRDMAAGFRRNALMVAAEPVPDECVAFLGPCEKRSCREPRPHDSHGTRHCADLAEQSGIPTRRYLA